MTALDNILAAISPTWGLKRMAARKSLAVLRSYDAAGVGRRTDGWVASGNSANAEVMGDAARLRWRARELARNNPYATTAIRKISAHVVGTGIIPSAEGYDDDVRRSWADDWARFNDSADPEGQTDFVGICHLVMRTCIEAGECLVRFFPRPSNWNLAVPLQCVVLEPDYLDTAKTLRLDNGNIVIMGVEFDPFGRRVAYWLFREHPGEYLPGYGQTFLSERVEARWIAHIFDRMRPGQARGVSWFAPVALKFRDLSDYDDADLMRKKIAACFAAIVTRNQPNELLDKEAETDQASGKKQERLRSGMFQYLRVGEEVKFPDMPTADGYLDWMVTQLRACASGVGMPYSMMTGDLSTANYSSERAGKIDFWQTLDYLQFQMLVPQLGRRTAAMVQTVRVLTGRQNDDAIRLTWTNPRRAWIDPLKDAKAEQEELAAGLKSYRDALSARGENADDQIAEIKKTQTQLDDAGIVLSWDQRYRVTTIADLLAANVTGDGGGESEANQGNPT